MNKRIALEVGTTRNYIDKINYTKQDVQHIMDRAASDMMEELWTFNKWFANDGYKYHNNRDKVALKLFLKLVIENIEKS